MVYKRSNIKVLLGPENLKHTITAQVNDGEEFPPKYGVRKTYGNKVFEKIGETNVYKRTRPTNAFHGKPPTLERYPSNLELSGKKVETDEEKKKAKSEEDTDATNPPGTASDSAKPDDKDTSQTRDTSASSKMKDGQSANDDRSQNRQKPKQGRSSANIIFSQNVLTDFGLSPQRTDTFSGHQRRRVSADIERRFEEQAERHIRTCQTVGNLKRSSRANQGYQGLKHTVSPLQSPMSFCSSNSLSRDKSFYRSDTDIDKTGMSTYLSQVRKHVSKPRTISQAYQKHRRLPEINGRTLIVGTSISIS